MVDQGREDDQLIGISGPDRTGVVVDEEPASSDPAGEVTVDAPVSAPLRLTLDRYLREQAAG